jgi:hypothetical protein
MLCHLEDDFPSSVIPSCHPAVCHPRYPAQVAALPGQEQLLVAGFLSQVSRSARPAHRLAAVEAAHALMAHLPAPFDPAAGYKVC